MIRPQGEITPGLTKNGPVDSDWPYVDPEILDKLMRLATQLFGGKASIEKSYDPEYAVNKYHVLRIETNLSPQEVVRAEKKWIEGLLDTAPGCQSIRLLIVGVK